jgi:hypothetical protein
MSRVREEEKKKRKKERGREGGKRKKESIVCEETACAQLATPHLYLDIP